MKRDESELSRAVVEGISGHYFLQYFNVKSSGFLEPWYRFLQEKPSGRSLARSGRGCSGRGKGRAHGVEKTAAPVRSFSCDAIFERRAASLRRGGGSRTIAPPPLRFLLPSLLFFSSLHFSLSLALSRSLFLPLPPCPTRSCFSYSIGEKASPPYIYIYVRTPTAYGTLPIRSRSNDT